MSAPAAPQGARTLSAIVACYRDERAIPLMADRLGAVLGGLGVEYEIIFVNDGSPDGSQAVLEQLAGRDRRIRVITHSRNFGAQNAFRSGLRRASGEACVLLDGDLQDPPELIAELHAKWREGYDVVYGVRQRREMWPGRELAYKAFYRLFRAAAHVPVPLDAGSFCLLDRRVVDALARCRERDRFLQGLRAWIGFRQTGVPYRRPRRAFGRSTGGLLWRLRWARNGFFSYSYAPLDLVWGSAAAVGLMACVAVGLELARHAAGGQASWGTGTLVALGLLLAAIQLACLAVVAEYASRAFEEGKRRPPYVVAKEIGFDD